MTTLPAIRFGATKRAEGRGAVAEQLPEREPMRVEDAEEAVEVFEGRFELGEGHREVRPDP